MTTLSAARKAQITAGNKRAWADPAKRERHSDLVTRQMLAHHARVPMAPMTSMPRLCDVVPDRCEGCLSVLAPRYLLCTLCSLGERAALVIGG